MTVLLQLLVLETDNDVIPPSEAKYQSALLIIAISSSKPHPPSHHFLSKMASSAGADSNVPTKQTFVVWAPDNTDPDAFSRRLDVRAEHKKRLDRLADEGIIS